MTLFFSFQLECSALGPRAAYHSFKRPEHHWAEETERKENLPVGSSPCCGGSSGETAGEKEVRLVWLFHFENSILTFWLLQTSVLWYGETQNCALVWGNTKLYFGIGKHRTNSFFEFFFPLNKARSFLKSLKALWMPQDQGKIAGVAHFCVSINSAGFTCWFSKQFLFIRGWQVEGSQKSVLGLQRAVLQKTQYCKESSPLQEFSCKATSGFILPELR